MSDPLEQMEIEDVLSSIRRLVTDGAETRATQVTGAAEKLILTPAQRINDDAADQADEPAIVLQENPPINQWDEASLEERIAELEAAIAYVEEDWEPDGSEIKRRDMSFEEIEAETGATDADDAPEELDSDPSEQETLERDTPEQSQPQAPIVLQPDSAAQIHQAPQVATVDAKQTQTLAEPQVFEAEIEAPQLTAQAPAQAEDPSGQEPVEAGSDQDDHRSAPDQQPPDSAGQDGNMFSAETGEETDILDEETLRQLVNDIVRQELQGELGERITRNVRKLVRREINRVLATRDFD